MDAGASGVLADDRDQGRRGGARADRTERVGGGGLTEAGEAPTVRGMKTRGQMREVGRITASPLERFGRNQRRAAAVAPGAGEPKGVRRFRTWEEFAQWQSRKTNPA